MMKDIAQMSRKLRQAFGDFRPQFLDSSCGEPIGWGYKLQSQITEQQWRQAEDFGELIFTGWQGLQSSYAVITKWLTAAEAQKKYGELSNLELGPRGGFKSATYGNTRFISKRMDPRK